jgi:hypothetical protein
LLRAGEDPGAPAMTSQYSHKPPKTVQRRCGGPRLSRGRLCTTDGDPLRHGRAFMRLC